MHRNAVNIVANIPNTKPEHINANGIARMPVPSEALSKCVIVSPSLQTKKKNNYLILCFFFSK